MCTKSPAWSRINRVHGEALLWWGDCLMRQTVWLTKGCMLINACLCYNSSTKIHNNESSTNPMNTAANCVQCAVVDKSKAWHGHTIKHAKHCKHGPGFVNWLFVQGFQTVTVLNSNVPSYPDPNTDAIMVSNIRMCDTHKLMILSLRSSLLNLLVVTGVGCIDITSPCYILQPQRFQGGHNASQSILSAQPCDNSKRSNSIPG